MVVKYLSSRFATGTQAYVSGTASRKTVAPASAMLKYSVLLLYQLFVPVSGILLSFGSAGSHSFVDAFDRDASLFGKVAVLY